MQPKCTLIWRPTEQIHYHTAVWNFSSDRSLNALATADMASISAPRYLILLLLAKIDGTSPAALFKTCNTKLFWVIETENHGKP